MKMYFIVTNFGARLEVTSEQFNIYLEKLNCDDPTFIYKSYTTANGFFYEEFYLSSGELTCFKATYEGKA